MRHGRVDYFSAEVLAAGDHRVARLTEQGRAEADAAGVALREAPLDIALSSGLLRTRETAEIVLSRHSQPPLLGEEPAFEELRGGTLRFASREEAAAAMSAQFAEASRPGARMFAGESFLEAQRRCVEALERLFLSGDWKTALLVAHEGVNRLMLSWAAGAGLSAASAFEQDTACVNVIDADIVADARTGEARIGRCMLKLINATPYNWLKHGMSRTSLEAIFAAD